MAKKEMCPQFGKGEDCPLKCPPGTNASCEIVPPVPPKEKDVVVKGWAHNYGEGDWDISEDRQNHFYNIPCTITVKAKDLRKARE